MWTICNSPPTRRTKQIDCKTINLFIFFCVDHNQPSTNWVSGWINMKLLMFVKIMLCSYFLHFFGPIYKSFMISLFGLTGNVYTYSALIARKKKKLNKTLCALEFLYSFFASNFDAWNVEIFKKKKKTFSI